MMKILVLDWLDGYIYDQFQKQEHWGFQLQTVKAMYHKLRPSTANCFCRAEVELFMQKFFNFSTI